MELILYTADCTGIPSNCVYPHEVVVDSKEKMAEAIEKDHVCAKYKNNYRSNDNFMEANGFFMDNDNDHTDNPAEFITAKKLSEMLADVDHVIVPSRHNMLPKGSKPAKPRQHIYFPCQPYKDSTMYAAVKRAIQKKFPFLDDNAMDAARFFFGSSCDPDDIIWNEGFLQIDETLDESDYIEEAVEKEEYQTGGGVIHEGSRNNTLSLFAGKVLKKFGITDKAHDLFLERAAKCDPPLDDRELKTIWNSAVGFAKKIQSQEGYVPPEEFNAEFDAGLKPEDYSDIGEAKVLAKEYGSELKFTTATDYLRFDGECWREDRQMALGAAEDFLDLQLADAKEQVEIAEQALLGAGVSEENVKSGGKQLEKAVPDNSMGLLFALMSAQTYLKFVLRYRNYKNIVNFQNAAKPMLAIDVSELDKDPNLLNTPYATFDLEKGMAGELPHNPEDLITKITNCSPGDKGEQIWSDALDTFFCSDKELIEYVQMTVGMAAIGKVYQEHMIIAYGGGANGKSTFWNTIFRVLGSYAGKISAEALTMGCKRNVKPEMAELKGKRLIIASEMEEGVRLNTATVKQLCSTDEIQAEKKYKDPFHFVPSHTLVLYKQYTELRKAELFAKVRSGQVRFLLGSTAKMGAGTNVQDRLIALHHLDVPWRPSDIEQQEGRILRQGNQNDKVKIFRYVTEGTFDSYSWQLIENKQKFIGQIMTSKSPVRSCEDVDEAALSYAEVKALATGNPYIKEKMDLDIQVSKLKLMKANHTSQKYRLEDNITQRYPHQIAVFKERIEGFTADMEKYAKNKPEDKEQFFMQVGGKPYTDKKEAGTAIIAMCKEIKGINASADVGEYLGFKLNVTFDSFNNKFVMNVKGAMSHPMEVGSDAIGNITRINNVLETMPAQLEEAQTKLANVEHQLETAKAEVDKPFPQEAELAEKLERLAELNALLNMDEKGDDSIGMDDEAMEPEKTQEDMKSVDKKRDEVADMPAKQSNLGKTVTDGKLSDRPAERTSLQEKLAAMKARVSGTPAGRDAADKAKKKEEIL